MWCGVEPEAEGVRAAKHRATAVLEVGEGEPSPDEPQMSQVESVSKSVSSFKQTKRAGGLGQRSTRQAFRNKADPIVFSVALGAGRFMI